MANDIPTKVKVDAVIELMKDNVHVNEVSTRYKVNPKNLLFWKNDFIVGGQKQLENKSIFQDKNYYQSELRYEITENQQKIIRQLMQLLNQYKLLLKKYGITNHKKRLTLNDKAEIIDTIENYSANKAESLRFIGISKSAYYSWKKEILKRQTEVQDIYTEKKRKFEKEEYINLVFSILHTPPKEFNINRTSWRLQDIHSVLKTKELPLGKNYIHRIIKDAGYRFRSAKKVLTSTDPDYREKLKQITGALSKLKANEKFFSIDEFGPFAIKMQGGKSYVPPGKARVVPQIQKSKGFLIITAALELSTNQITHFYSKKKDTEEMIKLLELLVSKYFGQRRIFFSWDAASWHASKKFIQRVNEHNKSKKLPKVKLAPLPACAQFLNVIESVFSGMAKAIIHNSDYQSTNECTHAIDRYFKDRNKFYTDNPKRAGNKIWGSERVEPKFSESNNCKDPQYLHDFKRSK